MDRAWTERGPTWTDDFSRNTRVLPQTPVGHARTGFVPARCRLLSGQRSHHEASLEDLQVSTMYHGCVRSAHGNRSSIGCSAWALGVCVASAQVYRLTVPCRKGTFDGRKVAPLVAIAFCSAGSVAADVCVRPCSPESMLMSDASMAWAC